MVNIKPTHPSHWAINKNETSVIATKVPMNGAPSRRTLIFGIVDTNLLYILTELYDRLTDTPILKP